MSVLHPGLVVGKHLFNPVQTLFFASGLEMLRLTGTFQLQIELQDLTPLKRLELSQLTLQLRSVCGDVILLQLLHLVARGGNHCRPQTF
ncbi:hypothetical protein D3C76_1698340 [compost metagenome]